MPGQHRTGSFPTGGVAVDQLERERPQPPRPRRPAAAGNASRSPDGPYDGDEDGPVLGPVAAVDFGAVRVPIPEGGAVTTDPAAPDGPMQAVHIALATGRLSVSALAAPKSAKLWPDLAKEIDASLREAGARVRSFPGDWGRELHATTGAATSLFVGVDGPRWMLYGVATGPTSTAAELAGELRRMLRGTVVVRGRSPYPVRTVLPLALPEGLLPVDGAVVLSGAAKASKPARQSSGTAVQDRDASDTAAKGIRTGGRADRPVPAVRPRPRPTAAGRRPDSPRPEPRGAEPRGVGPHGFDPRRAIGPAAPAAEWSPEGTGRAAAVPTPDDTPTERWMIGPVAGVPPWSETAMRPGTPPTTRPRPYLSADTDRPVSTAAKAPAARRDQVPTGNRPAPRTPTPAAPAPPPSGARPAAPSRLPATTGPGQPAARRPSEPEPDRRPTQRTGAVRPVAAPAATGTGVFETGSSGTGSLPGVRPAGVQAAFQAARAGVAAGRAAVAARAAAEATAARPAVPLRAEATGAGAVVPPRTEATGAGAVVPPRTERTGARPARPAGARPAGLREARSTGDGTAARPTDRFGRPDATDARVARVPKPAEATGTRPGYAFGPGEATGARLAPIPAESAGIEATRRPARPVAESLSSPSTPASSNPLRSGTAGPWENLRTVAAPPPRPVPPSVRPDSATLPLPAVPPTPAVEPTAVDRSRHGLPDLDRSSATQGLPVVPTTAVQSTGRHHRVD